MTKKDTDHDRNAAKKNALRGIRIWMAARGVNARKISMGYGRSEQFISLFLQRRRASKGLVDYLVSEGCPKEYFQGGRIVGRGARQ